MREGRLNEWSFLSLWVIPAVPYTHCHTPSSWLSKQHVQSSTAAPACPASHSGTQSAMTQTFWHSQVNLSPSISSVFLCLLPLSYGAAPYAASLLRDSTQHCQCCAVSLLPRLVSSSRLSSPSLRCVTLAPA